MHLGCTRRRVVRSRDLYARHDPSRSSQNHQHTDPNISSCVLLETREKCLVLPSAAGKDDIATCPLDPVASIFGVQENHIVHLGIDKRSDIPVATTRSSRWV